MSALTGLALKVSLPLVRSFLDNMSSDGAMARAIAQAKEDMLYACVAAVGALVQAQLGPNATDKDAEQFLMTATSDPAFHARMVRLFQEGMKSPSGARREMLARALLAQPKPTSERDRVDAAVERLFPEDVTVLAALAKLGTRAVAIDSGEDFLVTKGLDLGDSAASVAQRPDTIQCTGNSMGALVSTACVRLGDPVWRGHALAAERSLAVLPLGKAVLRVLGST